MISLVNVTVDMIIEVEMAQAWAANGPDFGLAAEVDWAGR